MKVNCFQAIGFKLVNLHLYMKEAGAPPAVDDDGGGDGEWDPPIVWEEVEMALEPWRVAGRREVMAMAAQLEASGTDDVPTLVSCMCELLRQVTCHCSERGRVMSYIW